MTKRRSSSSARGRSSSSRTRSSSRSRGRHKPPLWQRLSKDQRLDILGWSLAVLSALTILSMLSAEQGVLTHWWITLLRRVFGWGRFIVPVFLGAFGLWLVLRRFGDRLPTPGPGQIVGVLLGFFVVLVTLHYSVTLVWPEIDGQSLGRAGLGGGLLGALLLQTGRQALGPAGIVFTLFIGWIAIIALMANISPAEAARVIAEHSLLARRRHENSTEGHPTALEDPYSEQSLSEAIRQSAQDTPARRSRVSAEEGDTRHATPSINVGSRASNGTDSLTRQTPDVGAQDELSISPLAIGTQTWRLPVMEDILQEGGEQSYSEDLIRKQVHVIEDTLASLGAPVRVNEINQGPVVTQFGAEPLFVPGRGGKSTKVKVSRITNLADDLALALSARSIRIQAPIPGKGLVGIEVPNEEATIVALRDVIDSDSFDNLKGRLRLGLGQDVSGQAVAADLRAMPHLLIAGATGAGKSVCVNAVITAMLIQNSPDTLRLILVDPKRVELTQYNGIPHLLAPVITDVDRVVPTLRWVTREMDTRYRRFANIGARNIDDFNQRVHKSGDQSPIPYIAVLIDELADVMMQAPDEAERVICRLAQMARATGIHLIIATQRPSVDVVTGLIKANFPARIAFAVASSVDSRVILDTPGAERLLGRGDMLFMPPDVSQPLRLQGAHVTDQEISRLIRFWRNAIEPTNDAARHAVDLPKPNLSLEEVITQPQLFPTFDEPTSSAFEFEDELVPACVEIFLAENRASVSLLQRRLRIGYTRAARLLELLEDLGIVSDEMKGQSRMVNRAIAEELLRSINTGEQASEPIGD
jgi:DNA segregation ATPase FtsK/SpoIIIE, S-DNA-T family